MPAEERWAPSSAAAPTVRQPCAHRRARARIPVVITTRAWNGRVLPNYGFQGGGKTLQDAGAIFADNLSPQKARILLMLALQSNTNAQEIQRMFDR